MHELAVTISDIIGAVRKQHHERVSALKAIKRMELKFNDILIDRKSVFLDCDEQVRPVVQDLLRRCAGLGLMVVEDVNLVQVLIQELADVGVK